MPDPDDMVLAALQEAAWPRTVATVAASTGLRQRLVTKTLERLADEGRAVRVRRGVYAAHR